jgi:REP element-mobilizing transposase RayT
MSHFDYRSSYRRNLPHVQPPGAVFFVTFRLSGSLPQSAVAKWKRQRQWLQQLAQTNPAHYERRKRDFEWYWFNKLESILDGGKCGPVWLGYEKIAKSVAESLHYRDGDVYRLDAFSIMPNHVHIVFKPLPLAQPLSLEKGQDQQVLGASYHSLASIMQSLKGFTAFEANRLLIRKGEFWAHESYDHYVRSAGEWHRIMKYVVNNPVKARYVKNWQEWKWNYRRV